MIKTKLFKSNTTQAVRLPKDVAWPEGVTEVEIVVLGDSRLITPSGMAWDFWFEHASPVSIDFMAEREQPAMQDRSAL